VAPERQHGVALPRRFIVFVVLTALLSVLTACTGASVMPAATSSPVNPSPAMNSSPSEATPTATSSPTQAPRDVVGMGVDQAVARIQSGNLCGVTEEHIVHRPGTHVGQVLAERVVSPYCEVELTVSAGSFPASAAECHSLTAHEGSEGVGLGNYGVSLIFRNTGHAVCTLGGYPDLTAREQGSNRIIVARHTPQGYLGGAIEPLLTYVLLPGDAVSAMFEETDNPMNGQHSCPVLRDYLVTAGGRTTALPGIGSNCSGIEMHPYVPGSIGSDVR
jgi:hypothetical protein